MEFKRFAIGAYGGVFFLWVVYSVFTSGPAAPLFGLIKLLSGSAPGNSFIMIILGLLVTIVLSACFLYVSWSAFFSDVQGVEPARQAVARVPEQRTRELRMEAQRKEFKEAKPVAETPAEIKAPMINIIYYVFLGALVVLALYFIFFAGR